MATGVFDTSGQNWRRRKKPGKAKADEPLERFAELLSEHDSGAADPGGSITLVASRMGIPTRDAYSMFKRLCDGLGWQAYDVVPKRSGLHKADDSR